MNFNKLKSLTKLLTRYQFRPYFIVIWTNFILLPHFSNPSFPNNAIVCFKEPFAILQHWMGEGLY